MADAFSSDAFMDGRLSPALFALALFLAMGVCLEIGARIGARCRTEEAERARGGVSAVEGAIFGLLRT